MKWHQDIMKHCWTNLSYYPIIDSISNITPSNVPVKLSNRWSSSETQMLIKEVGKQQQVKILKNKEAHAEEEKMNMEKLCTFFKELTETITKIINDQYFSTSEMQQKQHNEQDTLSSNTNMFEEDMLH
ncbi:hypothetical protein C2G38_2192606 [Gigaspora rosea]|uniref:Uncharacterized protein n=1 Tax=Gigaspora rosea TaxID=44941 RepID=A0A397UYL1_9GLOM|nr:hypothetical protein C2G38_2192606 [Gigaspora rosea]